MNNKAPRWMKYKPYTIAIAVIVIVAALSLSVYRWMWHNNRQYVNSFTISAPFINRLRLQGAAHALRQTLEEQERDIPVHFMHYPQEEWQDHQSLLLSQFAAGLAPDIFIRGNIMLDAFIENGFLADIYTIIDQSYNFTRDDFFTNVLEGVEINGQLYMLPIDFSIDFIGINANVPQSFIDRFAAIDRATAGDITALYLDLVGQYPEWAAFAFIHGLDATEAFLPELNNAVNFAGRTTHFANTPNILENIRMAFTGNEKFSTRPTDWLFAFNDMAVKQERYVFSRIYDRTAGIYGLFEFSEPLFVNYVPLADENGRLINRNWSMEIVVSRTACPELAMEFIARAITDGAAQNALLGTNIPILRRYFRQGLEADFNRLLVHKNLSPIIANSESIAVAQAIAQLETYSAWPSATLHSAFLMSHHPAIHIFHAFMEGDAPAYEAIRQMEAATNAWFAAERPEIEKYVPWELQPRRTLTVRARCVDVRIIRQAAEAMQADWQKQERPYNFHVEIDYYSWLELAGVDTRSMRFQIELMTGLGADIIMFDPFKHNIHTLVDSGLLQDFNSIIENCPYTSRDAFFTQALDAFIINNGLYVFPTSFGMNYIGVNASLPEAFLNRFAQKSSITLVEMMEFYLDLMDEYGDAFGHLIYTDADGMTFFDNTLQAVMGEFVDFNARTVNLIDPRFIETLELMRRVQDYRSPWEVGCIAWSEPWGYVPGTEWLFAGENIRSCRCPRPCASWWSGYSLRDQKRYMAQTYLFYAKSENLSQYRLFFTEDRPPFVHHIPLADYYGRLLIDTPGAFRQVWSGICITSGADTELAWEFARHLIDAYANPSTFARNSVSSGRNVPLGRSRGDWGAQSLASPILRSTFRESTFRNFEDAHYHWYRRLFNPSDPSRRIPNVQQFTLPCLQNFGSRSSRAEQFEAAIDRIAGYNEQPMAMLWPMIPQNLVERHLDYFLRGIINAETAAQRMQNAIYLWLIE